MNDLTVIDAARFAFDIHSDRSVQLREHKPGPPERIDGFTVEETQLIHITPGPNGDYRPRD